MAKTLVVSAETTIADVVDFIVDRAKNPHRVGEAVVFDFNNNPFDEGKFFLLNEEVDGQWSRGQLVMSQIRLQDAVYDLAEELTQEFNDGLDQAVASWAVGDGTTQEGTIVIASQTVKEFGQQSAISARLAVEAIIAEDMGLVWENPKITGVEASVVLERIEVVKSLLEGVAGDFEPFQWPS